MRAIGIVAEYNPFHKGHEHHIRESVAALGGDADVICVMSGDFVQRGEPALFSKFARAEAAVRSGVSLVLELPLPWCLSSAEGFGRGAVGLLESTGIVDFLSFGSEAGELAPLNVLAVALMDPAPDAKILAELEKGVPYAAARQRALEKDLGELARLLEKPNNILAVEYLKTLYELRGHMEPMTVKRSGAGHDRKGDGPLRSASELRGILLAGGDITAHIPEEAALVYGNEIRSGRGPVSVCGLEQALLSRLRMLPASSFHALPAASEGLENRLFAATKTEPSMDAVAAAAKTKRYALSRLRRMALCAALGIEKGLGDDTPPYARVLAADERGREVLRRMTKRSAVPVITKAAAVRSLSPEVRRIFELGAAAHDLYVLGFPAVMERRGGEDWRAAPRILPQRTSRLLFGG